MIHPSTPGAGDREGGEPLAKTLGGADAPMSAERVLERCSVVFFLTIQQLATVRDALEADGYPTGPGTTLGLIAHMKKQIQEQAAEIRALQARSAPEASSPKGPLPATPEVTP